MANAKPKPTETFVCAGCDTAGNPYESNVAMWASELDGDADCHNPASWYEKSSSFWRKQSPTVRGMLGGLDQLHDRDIRASSRFIRHLTRAHGLVTDRTRALDVGAGIGRITRALLLPLFSVVDMLEQNKDYLDESIHYINNNTDTSTHPGSPSTLGIVENRFASSMQNFTSSRHLRRRYHLIWIQWCIIYLTDDDLVSFLRVCFDCLAQNGIVCIKDNIAPRGQAGFVLDKEDSSVMRGDTYMKNLFARAGAIVISQTTQNDFPTGMFPVKTWALRPQSASKHAEPNHTSKKRRM